MNYRGLPLTAEPTGSTYVPVSVHSWSFPQHQLVDQTMCMNTPDAVNGYVSVDGVRFLVTVDSRTAQWLRIPRNGVIVAADGDLRLSTASESGGVLSATTTDVSVATASLVNNAVVVHGVAVGTCTVTVTVAGTSTLRPRSAAVQVSVVAGPATVLTDTRYKMTELYPDNAWQTMTELPAGTLFDTSALTTMDQMFSTGYKVRSLDLRSLDTSNVTSMFATFSGLWECTSIDLSNFDTSSVTNMAMMFYSCISFTTLDLSNFDTSSVTSMAVMFGECSSLTTLDLSNFDTSSVANMIGMFDNCSSLTTLDLSNFDTSSVTNLNAMFSDCTALEEVDCVFDLSSMTAMNFGNMFKDTQVTEVTFKNVSTAIAADLTIANLGLSAKRDGRRSEHHLR